MTCIRAMGSGFNCNLDIIRYFHQNNYYVLICILRMEGVTGNTPLWGGGEGGWGGESSV